MLYTAEIAWTGPAGPHDMAFWIKTIPSVLIILPINPTQNKYRLNSTRHQYGIAAKRINILTRKYAEKDIVLGLNFTLSLIKCFVNIPFVVKLNGVIIPSNTGIQVGVMSILLI